MSKPEVVMGLDISMRSTGVAIVDEGMNILHISTTGGTKHLDPDPEIDCILRADIQIRHVIALLRRFCPTVLVIEGPAYGAKGSRACQLWQFTGALKYAALNAFDGKIVIAPPKTVKKHITGNGNAGKDDMIEAVKKRFGLDIKDNNQCDAFSLCVFHLDKTKRR
ncbi:MAG: crossover junction endodeoxyribonuclease RuvC [Desulfobacteraceae bacterium]|nr:crossover junction endodeoxyribonuclease RuvC [Desulfobacteraceae bacterium]